MKINTFLEFWKEMMESWKDMRIWKSLAIDVIFIIVIVLLVALFALLLKSQSVVSGMSIQELQLLAITAPDQAVGLLQAAKAYFVILFLGFFVLAILFLILTAASRRYLWKVLTRKAPYSLRRWIGMELLVLYLLTGYFLVVFLMSSFYRNFDLAFLSTFLSFILLTLTISFISIVHYAFAHSGKVWASVGMAFHLVSVKSSKMAAGSIAVVGVLLLLTAITRGVSILFATQLNASPGSIALNVLFQVILVLVYISWVRVSLVRVVE